MGKAYENLWTQIEGDRGWNKANADIKELITNPLLWATNLIEYATQNRTDGMREGVNFTGMNEAAWQQVNVALDVLKWIGEEEE